METNLCLPVDNQTIISDISENSIENTQNIGFEDKINTLKLNLNKELNKLNVDNLREKAKELGIIGLSKSKKPDLISILEKEFMKLIDLLKEKKADDLKNIRKNYGIKRIASAKKEILLLQILDYCSINLLFKIDESKFLNESKNELQIEESTKSLSLIEQLEKQKQEIEVKMQEEIKKKEEEAKQIALEEERKKEEEAKKIAQEAKKKKQSIPKNVRAIVWSHYIGEDIIKHKCLCCKKVTISNTNFEVGHVLSEKNGGTHEINNLRPICFACNHSMGSENMIDFVVKFGLFIG